MNLIPVRRALISVSEKAGIVELAQALQSEFSMEIISTGGTATALKKGGVVVQDVADLTGFPEMMDGRVKTLHPAVHGGLLGVRDNPEHQAAMQRHRIAPIDLLIVNLYPFEKVTAAPDCPVDRAIENIDIGGPAMIRSAAKNHAAVTVVTDPQQYPLLLATLRDHGGSTPETFRRSLARQAFGHTSRYDATINSYLGALPPTWGDAAADQAMAAGEDLPPLLLSMLKKLQDLRYGENPHQHGAFYALGSPAAGLAALQQRHGKELSYINLLDADAALALVAEYRQPAAAVLKHANPCGCGIGSTLAEAFDQAYAGDPVAAFGGIVALNEVVDAVTAAKIADGKRFLEVLIAPGYAPDALKILQQRWADCRILELPSLGRTVGGTLGFRSVWGGMLVQQMDMAGFDRASCQVVSQRPPTEAQWADVEFGYLVGKHVKSNAIAIVHGGQLLGTGAGQMSRVTSCRLAVDLARRNGHSEKLPGAVAASDAFFPFADGPQILVEAGIKCVVEPGGSKRDQETIDLCNQQGVALVFTGRRHFLH